MTDIVIITGGHLIDPAAQIDALKDLKIADGNIVAVADPGQLPDSAGATAIDASGCHILPGLIDTHTHLREPGFEYKETIADAARTAVHAGITRLFAMPNTEPACDSVAVVEMVLQRGRAAGLAQVHPVGALTRHMEGQVLAEMAELAQAGCPAVSDAWVPVESSQMMRRALEYAHGVGLPVITVPQDMGLSADGVMHEGAVSTRLGLTGIPAASEEIPVGRIIALSELTGCRIHISPLSTAGAVRMVRNAQRRGVPVSAATAPHYLLLTDDRLEGFDTRAKVYPPLRSEADREALRQGVVEGTLTVLASCHAPHAAFEKEVTFDRAPFGMASLSTALSLTLQLVEDKVLSLSQAVACWTTGPQAVFGANAVGAARLSDGDEATLTIVDTAARWTVGDAAGASPFAGESLPGQVRHTFVAGRCVTDSLSADTATYEAHP